MKILFVTNASMERCGVRLYGAQMIDALRGAGIEVQIWDGGYEHCRQEDYLPRGVPDYDLIHFNWDPQAINHYLPQHFAGYPPLSLFLHDVPPNSTCPVQGEARWLFSFEPTPGSIVLPEAVPTTPADLSMPPSDHIRIGVSGIRNDAGFLQVREVCTAHGWETSEPRWWSGGPWLSLEDEIRRLAACHVNVCWYHTSGRGKSMAAMICCAARRPLLLSNSTMFSALWPYRDEITIGRDYKALEDLLEACVEDAKDEAELGAVPDRVCRELAWSEVIKPVIAAWKTL